MLKATALLEDTASGQAAFHVWPASHRVFHKYIQQFPEEVDGGFRAPQRNLLVCLAFAGLTADPDTSELSAGSSVVELSAGIAVLSWCRMFGGADNRVEERPELFTSHFHNAGYEFFHAHSPDEPKRAPVEFVGKAGDTILWDNRQAPTNASGLWQLLLR